jgi:hypothetical protein
MIGAAVLVAVPALAAVAVVAWPLVMHRVDVPEEDPAVAARQAIDEDLQRSLDAIREIDMDHRAGNLSDADFAALDGVERANAVKLMRAADELAPTGEGWR